MISIKEILDVLTFKPTCGDPNCLIGEIKIDAKKAKEIKEELIRLFSQSKDKSLKIFDSDPLNADVFMKERKTPNPARED